MVTKIECPVCKTSMLKKNLARHLLSRKHKLKTGELNVTEENREQEVLSVNLNDIPNLEVINNFKNTSFQIRQHEEFLNVFDYKPKFKKALNKFYENKGNLDKFKLSLSIKAEFVKDELNVIHSIQTKYISILAINQSYKVLEEALNSIEEQIQERYFQGSGLVLNKILFMDLWLAKFKNTKKGGCHKILPFKTNAVVNYQSADKKCFLNSLLLSCKIKTPINIISFPVYIKDVPKIEKENNLHINIFGLRNLKSSTSTSILDYSLEPLYLTDEFEDEEKCIDLLLYDNHYMLIKDIHIFFRNDQKNRKYLCRRCMNAFERKETLINHQKKCSKNDYCEIIMPKNNNLKFKNYSFKNRAPFVIYADFESLNIKVSNESNLENNLESKTKKIINQIPAAVGIYIHSDYPDLFQSQYFFQRSENVEEAFCNWLIDMEELFSDILKTNKEMNLSPEEEKEFQESETCYYCKHKFIISEEMIKDKKVRDHNHYNGKFRGASHNNCNFQAKHCNFVPIFFHNLSNYDAHLFIKTLAKKTKKKIKVLAKTAEEYISFQFGCFRFLDSMRFFQKGLDSVSKSMVDEDFKITRYFYPNDGDFKLLRKKGSVPYSFYNSHESFKVTELTYEMFFDELKNEMEPKSTFEKAKEIWDYFKCKNHGEFIDLYLKTDVILLADSFEKFREFNLKYFEIDPCHCYSTPGLTWQAGLKYSNINLELLTDVNMLLSFENSIRGGISGIMGTRHVKADDNHKLLYVDANNLYGWAMMENLPENDFKMYVPENSLVKEDILAIEDNSPIGYFLEVDLEYPESIKFKSVNFPFCPESIFIEDDDLSHYQKEVLGDQKRCKVNKLILTQRNKYNYIVHYRTLKFYLQQGMILRKVHNIISFKQRKWLAPYIDFNTQQRMKGKTPFEKDFFKLMNNAFYGKTCEDIRKRKEVELVTEEERSLNLHANPKFDSEIIFDEDLSAILMRKTSQVFNKPIYIGATVLELSKLLMYEFYYKTLQPYFGEKNIEILYHDTDSFVLKLKTDDLNSDLIKLKNNFDFSNYPKEHSLYDKSKEKVPGYFKDELGGKEMEEFIALKSKMYAYKTKGEESKKLKGLTKHVISKKISFEDYKNSLTKNETYSHKMRTLRSKKHDMIIEEVDKKSLNPFDDKRFILDDGITTLPFGSEQLINWNLA